MAFKIIISSEAKKDLEHSYLFYSERVNESVAKNFTIDFKNSIKILSKNPFFRICFDDVRGKSLKSFRSFSFTLLMNLSK